MGNAQDKISSKVAFLIATVTLLTLVAAMFGDVLLTPKTVVLSKLGRDTCCYFADLRNFGFNQLRQGNLPLWNPHIFSGAPYFAGFQSALLYPLNLPYLVLPLPKAINFTIALHVLLIGTFMYSWNWHRRLHPLACLFSSVLLMFCGAHFMNIYPGHLSTLCSMIWAPLLFLSIDGLRERHSLSWCLLGMFAITMQILAGHPQSVFCTGVAAIIYSGFRIIKAKQLTVIALGLTSMFAGAIALSAVQLLPGIQEAGESVRSGSLPYEYAARFSFPPENLITLVAPGFFGNMTDFCYWGRWYLWAMSLFISVTGFVLAIYGAIHGDRSVRCLFVTMALILMLLAFGAYTPLFRILHTWVPGFNKFRGNFQFIFQASVFLIMLASIGIDHIIRHRNINRRTPVLILAAGISVGIAAIFIRHSAAANPTGLWQQTMHALYVPKQIFLSQNAYMNANFVREAGFFASKSLMISAGTFLLLSALFLLARFSNKVAYVIVLLAIAEIFVFARTSRPTFELTATQLPGLKSFLAKHPGDYRILQFRNPNSAMSLDAYDIWGYDPCQPERYAQFIAFTQGLDPDDAVKLYLLSRFHPLHRMLRCRYAFVPVGNKIRVTEIKDVMPRLQLVQDYLVIPDRDDIFKTMEASEFDPRQQVIFETPPDPKPVKSEEKGTTRILDSSTDHLTIEAHLPNPAILLITDAYSSGWHARALPGSIQKQYDVMPANYILRAIPLSKGHHRIRVEYLPTAFQVGKWISIVSAIIYIGFLGRYVRRRFQA